MTRLHPSFHDYAVFHPWLRIIDRETRELVPLTLRREQQRLYNQITRRDAAGEPARFVILKARQIGFSTAVQSFFAHRAFTRSQFHALTVSHEEESTRVLHAMSETMYRGLPPQLRRGPLEQDTTERGKRLYLKNGSQLRVQTAGGDGDVGRSAGAQALHLSEAAHYPNAEATAMSALNLVQDRAGTLIVIESTANGEGNWFQRQWLRASEGVSGYTPVFSPWFADAHYTRPDLVPAYGLDDLDDEEAELRREHGVADAQLAWRRHQLRQPTYDGDLDRFHQEMPASAEEAFVSSGRPFFGSLVRRFQPVDPLKIGDFVLSGYARRAAYRFDEAARGVCHLWELPKKDRRYVATLDPAGRVTDREADAFQTQRDAEDFSVITVTDAMTSGEVCTWRDRRDPSMVAFVLAAIGNTYNKALVSVENTGGYGGVALDRLQQLGYANLHRETRYDSVRHRTTTQLGHDTTTVTRPRVLEALRDTLRDHPELLRDARLRDEMRVFHYGRDGVPRAQAGYHDDLVMARAWSLHLARLHPQAVRVAKPRRRLAVAA